MSEKYIIPVLVSPSKQVQTISYVGTIAAGANVTLLSNSIPFNVEVVAVKMIFDNDHVNNVLHYWIVSTNPSRSTTGVPSGDNIFARFSPTAYFIGDSAIRTILSGFKRFSRRTFLKLHITNNNAYVVDVSAEAYVREID